MSETTTRMAPEAPLEIDAVQGWAMTCHAPASAMTRPVDVLFLHGMSAGGWIWPEEWIAAFTGAGYRCWTMSLPGRSAGQTMAHDPAVIERALIQALQHGQVDLAVNMLAQALPGASLLDGPSLDDFAQAVQEAIAQIDRPVVLVGHSLGGAVAQNLMRRGGAPAGTVLICSVPPYGNWRASMEMALFNPELWQTLADFSLFGLRGIDPEILRANFFPNGISELEYRALLANLRDESLAATAQAMGLPPFAPLPGPRSDVLVLGGAEDRIVPVTDVMMTGFYYGGLAKIIPGCGHVLMREHLASEAVTHILSWLQDIDRKHEMAA